MQHCMSRFKPRSVSVLLFLHQSFVSAACLPFSPCSCGQDTDHSSSSVWGWKSIPAGSSLFKSFSLHALHKCKDFLWRLHSFHTLPSAPLSLGMLTIRSKMNHSGYQEHGGEALALWPQAVVLFVSCVAGFHVWKCRTPGQHLAEPFKPCDGACRPPWFLMPLHMPRLQRHSDIPLNTTKQWSFHVLSQKLYTELSIQADHVHENKNNLDMSQFSLLSLLPFSSSLRMK